MDILQLIHQLGGTFAIEGLNKSAFINLCGRYPELLMERDKNGKIMFRSPMFGGSGFREGLLIRRVGNWCEAYGKGETGSSNLGFDLPNGATRSPDAFWISEERMVKLTPDDIEKSFLPVVPDFVVELRSASDSLKKLQAKVKEEWIAQGARLAWLIDPYKEKAYVYRADGSQETIDDFEGVLSGEAVLSGFELVLSEFRMAGKSS